MIGLWITLSPPVDSCTYNQRFSTGRYRATIHSYRGAAHVLRTTVNNFCGRVLGREWLGRRANPKPDSPDDNRTAVGREGVSNGRVAR